MSATVAAFHGVDDLLRPDAIRTRLRPLLAGADADCVAVHLTSLRYKPSVSALLGLRLEWSTTGGPRSTRASLYLGEQAAAAAAKAATLRLVEARQGPTLAHDSGAMLLAFPNDRTLRGLSAAADIRRLGNRLTRAGGPLAGHRVRARHSTVCPVRWKPERRAVLRAALAVRSDDGARASLVRWIRVHPADAAGTVLARWRHATRVPGLVTPSLVDDDAERGLLMLDEMGGVPMTDLPDPGPRAAAAMLDALARLHRSEATEPIGCRSDADALASARAPLVVLAGLDARLAPAAQRLVARLETLAARLSPPPRRTCHGDLTADQWRLDAGAPILLDFDELILGDPHADLATLAGDFESRGQATLAAHVNAGAAAALGEDFDPDRWAWQRGLAASRTALAGLQRAEADWRETAAAALARAEQALGVASSAPRRATPPSPRDELAWVLDRSRRHEHPACADAPWEVTAVWPEADGVAVRLESGGAPHPRWLRIGARAAVHDGPHDPALPALARCLAGGEFAIAGHRLGRRAALRHIASGRFLFLRPHDRVTRAYQALRLAHLRLESAGVPASRLLEPEPDVDGWWMTGLAGDALRPLQTERRSWVELGAVLARVHTSQPRMECTGPGDAVGAARNQVARDWRPDTPFARTLAGWLDALALEAPAPGTPAWVHGDLHPGQMVLAAGPRILDWERARPGEAEEDLGNLLAHLVWEAPRQAATAWHALATGYAVAGGRWSRDALRQQARLSLVRVLAVHAWRDAGRDAARSIGRWTRTLEEVHAW